MALVKILLFLLFIPQLAWSQANVKEVNWLPNALQLKLACQNPLNENSLNKYLQTQIIQEANHVRPQHPIRAYITHFSVNESFDTDSLIYGKIEIKLTYGLLRNDDTVHLHKSSHSLGYKRSCNNPQSIYKAIEKIAANSRIANNEWLSFEYGKNPKLAKQVVIQFEELNGISNKDTVFYSTIRPLNWQDFKGKPLGTRYGAVVFPAFSYTGKQAIVNDSLVVTVQLKVYMLPESSWLRSGHGTAYALEHEQRHFDIVRLAVEEFKRRVTSESYFPEEYNGRLAFHYLKTLSFINKKQEAYDNDTQHGTNTARQAIWNKRITEEIRKLYDLE